MRESIVMLHGFAGTHRAFDSVLAHLPPERYRPLALDLPGHGDQSDTRPITFAGCVASVLAASPESFTLCGYSMGGRVALQVALASPERLQRLVLVSTSAGIEEAAERARRRAADRQLAEQLERMPFDQFVERWRSQPLFAADPPWVDTLAQEDQRRNHPAALAAALRGIGTGEMQSLWDRLHELTVPVTILAGERDHKFRALAERMTQRLRRAELVVVPGGHRLLLESPAAVAGALQYAG